MSRILVDSIRSNSASADAITLDGSGNLTIPGNATCSGTATGFGIGGKILQVVYGTTGSQVFNYTATLADTGLTATITPSATTSKILVIVSQAWMARKTNAGYAGGNILIFRGSTQITDRTGSSNYDLYTSAGGATAVEVYDRFNLVQLDEPSTTSATTYKTQGAAAETVSGGSFIGYQTDNRDSYITLMEIGA
jgi:hypothetical protein